VVMIKASVYSGATGLAGWSLCAVGVSRWLPHWTARLIDDLYAPFCHTGFVSNLHTTASPSLLFDRIPTLSRWVPLPLQLDASWPADLHKIGVG